MLHLYLFSQRECEHKTSYSFSFKVAFIYFKTSEAVLQAGLYKAKFSRRACELEISPLNLLIFNFATLVTFQEHSFYRNLLPLCVSLS